MALILRKLLSLLLFLNAVRAIVSPDMRGCTILQSGKLFMALNEATGMAANAAAVLAAAPGIRGDVNAGAYDPLFRPGDLPRVIEVLSGVASMQVRTDIIVSLYCNEDHISAEGAQWVDNDYKNRLNIEESFGMPIYPINPAQPLAKPSELIGHSSYTSVGYNDQPRQNLRCGDQAHVLINPFHIDPPSSAAGSFETRMYQTILAGGLSAITDLDHIMPLSLVLLHEFVHIAGGRTADNQNTNRIGDHDPAGNRVYGWSQCAAVRSVTNRGPTTNIADCYAQLAQALYLQPNGKKYFWSAGNINKDTGAPVFPVGSAVVTKKRRSRMPRSYLPDSIAVPWFG